MLRERSFGAVVYRKVKDKTFFLLLLYERQGKADTYWDFPKGHMEAGENPIGAMRRELNEETGLEKFDIANGFEEKVQYMFRKVGELVSKEVVFYLVNTKEEKITISFEHKDFKWMEFEEAMENMKFKNSKEVLEKANEFLNKGGLVFQTKLV